MSEDGYVPVRRDSGYSPQNEDSDSGSSNNNVDKAGSSTLNGARASCDSGLGSPSPLAAARRWGRKYTRRSELRQLKNINRALEELASLHGGEIVFSYTPRAHPNLPYLNNDKTVLVIPKKAFEPPARLSSQKPSQPGDFLRRAGLTSDDLLAGRLPEIPRGGLAVVSNGLALDLLAVAEEEPENASAIVQFIFHFLEIGAAEVLQDRAVQGTLRCIRENQEYITSCTDPYERENFLFAPFILPRSVEEMCTLNEVECTKDLEEPYDEVATLGMNAPTSPPVEERGKMYVDENQVCGFQIMGDEGIKTLEISSIQDLPAVNCQVSSDDFILDQNSWPTQDEYSVIHSEDENFSVTATVIDLNATELVNHLIPEDEGGVGEEGMDDQQSVNAEPPESRDFSPCDGNGPAKPSSVQKRSRTRTVQIPSRFKDYNTETGNKRQKIV